LNRYAFSLFELLLVIILIGVISSLVIKKFDKNKSVKISKLEHIKSILKSSGSNPCTLKVYDQCKKIYLSNKNRDNIDINSEIFRNLEVYRVDQNSNLQRVKFLPIVLEDKVYDVCFEFQIYQDGSSSNYIVKQGEKFIVFYPYFQDNRPFITTDENIAISKFIKKDLQDNFKNDI
jgi:type II secretory pathway pseudopilin PulG